MRLAPPEARRARLRRVALVGLNGVALGELALAALFEPLEPWIGPPRWSLIALVGGAAVAALVPVLTASRPSLAANADDVAWVVTLGALAVLAGAAAAPVGLGALFFATALAMLAVRDPAGPLVVIACAASALVPIVHALLYPTLAGLVPLAITTLVAFGGFVSALRLSRTVAHAVAERDAALFERAPAARPRAATPAQAATSAGARSTGARASTGGESSRNAASDHAEPGWDALVERMRSSITHLAETAGVAARVQAELSGLAPPSNKIRVHLLRIAQEATTQALRHAEPRTIVVTLRRGEGGVVFELEDDGPATETTRQRRSIATLRGRAAALGGTAEVRRADGGWITKVRLPCEQLN